jgi:hypothetical protein
MEIINSNNQTNQSMSNSINSNNQTIQPMSNNQINQPMNNKQIKKQMNDIVFYLNQHISSLIQSDEKNISIHTFIDMMQDVCEQANKRINNAGDGYVNAYEQKYEILFYEISLTAEQICKKFENIQADVEEPLYISKAYAVELLSGVLNHCNAKIVEYELAEEPESEEPKAEEHTTDYKQKYEDLLQMFKKKLKEIDDTLYNVGRSLDRMEVSEEDVQLSIYGREISIDHIELDKSDVESSIGDVQELIEDIQTDLENINEGKEQNNA